MSDMLNIGTSALITSQGSLSTVSHNISNVNTEGYNRQRVDQATRIPNYKGGQYFGSGVQIDNVKRMFDGFLADQIRVFTSQQKQLDTYGTFARQVDDLLGAPELSLSQGLEAFFNSVHDVADDPTSIPARQVMLTQADTLAKRFNTLDAQLTSFNTQVNLNLDAAVKKVNLLSKGIADLNQAILEASSGPAGGQPNDLMDKRDLLINQLSEQVSVTVVKQDNGVQNIFIGNGQALVVGNSSIALNIVPNPADTTRSEVGYGPGGQNISAQLSGGVIGGLLTVRQEVIDPARSEMDTLAAGLVNTINAQHKVGITLSGNAGGDFFAPTGTPAPDAGNIRVAITDPRDIAVAFPVTTTTGSNNTGTAQLAVTAVDGSAAGFNPLTALSSNVTLTYNAASQTYTVNYAGDTATISYNPATDSGRTINLSALTAPDTDFAGATKPPVTITLSGVPGNGDNFTLSNSASGGFTNVGDNRNALALAELQVKKVLSGGTQTFSDSYGIMVANVATRTNQADVGEKTQRALLDQTKLRSESVSGVNLDEEAANLIKYQQAYQAASQIITVSNTVFNALINAV